jgi:hypothetical protein
LLEVYGGCLATLHPDAWKEVEAMAKTKSKQFDFDLDAVVELVERVGAARVIEGIGMDRLIQENGLECFLAQLTHERRRELKELLK